MGDADRTRNLESKKRMEQLGSLTGFTVDFLSTFLSYDQTIYWLGHKTELKNKLKEVFSVEEDKFSEDRRKWSDFYKTYFEWNVDFSNVLIPQRPKKGKWFLIFIPKGMTINLALKFSRKFQNILNSCGCDNLDKSFQRNSRKASNDYAIWVRLNAEPDSYFLHQLPNEVDPDMKLGITLLERIIFGLKYFTEIGKYLDVRGFTLCSGTKDKEGFVATVHVDNKKRTVISRYQPGSPIFGYGIRRVVNL